MKIYASPTFDMACQQFELVADVLEIPQNDRDRLKFPKRALTVSVPVRMDDGATRVFAGYRVQHHLSELSMRMAALSLGVKRVYDSRKARGVFP